jgi:hypothetical protein
MDELFSCRNCIHNSGQTLNIGRGIGLCLKHGSVIKEPLKTTCKYLHRKDLAWFIVDEAKSEHAAEFARFSGLVGLYNHEKVQTTFYSERYTWEADTFDSLTNALARYHLSKKKWIFIEALTGGIDGRRSMAQASLTRRYIDTCDTWKSAFRLTIDVVSQLSQEPAFLKKDIYEQGAGEQEAFWDVVLSRIVLIQEYGWHAGLEELQWFSDSVSGIELFDWSIIKSQLEAAIPKTLETIFRHATDNHGYFEQMPNTEDQFPDSFKTSEGSLD